MANKLTETPFKHVRPLRPMGHTRRSWIRETLEKGIGYKTHSNASLLRLLNRQYREIESLKASPWISVEDRLPEDAVHVFVKRRDRFCDRAELSSIYFDGLPAWYLPEGPTMAVGGDVTHWMPIPAMKEQSDE